MEINIGFDADGVLVDTESFQLSAKIKKYIKKHYNLVPINEDGYGIKEVYGCDNETEIYIWSKFVIYYSLFYQIRPWVKETIKQLREQGNKVFIVTSKACALEKNYKGFIVRFLFELGLKIRGVKVDGIEYCSLDNSAEDKLNVCRKRKIDIIIEDKRENIDRLSSELYVLCMDTKNNQKLSNENICRVYDFNDIFVNIQKYIGENTGRQNHFMLKDLKSKYEKQNMDQIMENNYYEWLRKYYAMLPFDHLLLKRSESRIRLVASIFSPIFKKIYHPIIIGKENIPKEKGIIYVCNHLCNRDMLFLLYAFHNHDMQWHPLVKQEVLDEKIGIIFREAYSVFVDRKSRKSRHIATQELAKLLVNGYNILIFPEGTYNKSSSNLKKFEGVSHVYLSKVLQKKIVNCALVYDSISQSALKIGEPYIVSEDMKIEDAKKDSYVKLYKLVEDCKQFCKVKRETEDADY